MQRAPTLTEAALFLRNSAPEEWEVFKRAFDEYTHKALLGCCAADASHIMEAKGMAQQCQALLRMFVECDQRPAPPQPPAPISSWAP